MKLTLKYLLLLLLFSDVVVFAQKKSAKIILKNPSAIERKEAVVSISWTDILKAYPRIDTSNFVITDSITKSEISYQLEHIGKPSIQNLLLQISVKEKSNLILLIKAGRPAGLEPKTFARFVPERKDDFAWENDNIAFRMYGKALENTPSENAYGVDVWVKNTNKLVVNERYKRDDYHKDHGDGLDYYDVGLTLGAGNIAPFVKDSVRYSKNYTSWKLLDNGPLRSTFQLIYDEWNAAGISVKVTKTISIDAGSQLNKFENVFSFDKVKTLPVVVGLVTRKEPGKSLLESKIGVIGYWEPAHGNDGIIGVGAVFTTPVSKMETTRQQLLAFTTAENDKPLVYYTGAAWNKAGKIKSEGDWFHYLENFKEGLKSPLQVSVK